MDSPWPLAAPHRLPPPPLHTPTPAGPLPDAWGYGGGWRHLSLLSALDNRLDGPLPQSWGHNGSLPQLQDLILMGNLLRGSLPDAWGSPGAFANLTGAGTSRRVGGSIGRADSCRTLCQPP